MSSYGPRFTRPLRRERPRRSTVKVDRSRKRRLRPSVAFTVVLGGSHTREIVRQQDAFNVTLRVLCLHQGVAKHFDRHSPRRSRNRRSRCVIVRPGARSSGISASAREQRTEHGGRQSAAGFVGSDRAAAGSPPRSAREWARQSIRGRHSVEADPPRAAPAPIGGAIQPRGAPPPFPKSRLRRQLLGRDRRRPGSPSLLGQVLTASELGIT